MLIDTSVASIHHKDWLLKLEQITSYYRAFLTTVCPFVIESSFNSNGSVPDTCQRNASNESA